MTEPAREAQPDGRIPAEALLCRSCDSALAIDQGYCLRCGELVAGVAPALPRSEVPIAPPPVSPASTGPIGLLPSRALAGVLAGGLALLVGGVLFGAAIAGEEHRPAQIRVQVPAAKAPVVNVAAPVGASAVEEPFASDWPDKTGWTVQLQELSKRSTTTAAIAAAKSAAIAQGAAGVGALDSDEHRSLDPGEFIVYSRYYRSRRDATAAARRLRRDFPDARAIKVAVAGGGSTKTSDRKLEDLERSSGEDFVKKSKKLPDKVQSEGAPPPTDDKPAGAGDEPEAIG